MTALRHLLWSFYGTILVIFLVAPIILVVFYSFVSVGGDGGLTLDWYRQIFRNPEFWKAFRNSLVVASIVGLISTVVGTIAALALSRMRSRPAAAIMLALALPMMLPPLLLGLSLLVAFVTAGITLGLGTVVLSHLIFTQPFVILVVYARLHSFDFSVVDSARDLGASPVRAFTTVTFPLIRTTVIGAALIAVSLSLDELIVTFFTIANANTLPTFIWGMIRTRTDPTINAIASLLLLLTVGSAAIAFRMSRFRG